MTLENFKDALRNVEEALTAIKFLKAKGEPEDLLFPVEVGVVTTLEVLELAFEDVEKVIRYFCFDLDFGKSKGSFTNERGVTWYLKSAEDVWDYLG